MKILVINGPNLNMLGIREPDIYGRQTYEDMRKYIMDYARQRELAVEVFQSNSEGEIVTKIQQDYGKKDEIIISLDYIDVGMDYRTSEERKWHMEELRRVEEEFCQAYLRSGYCGTKAYLAVKPNVKVESASKMSREWLKKPKIRDRIAQLQQEVFDELFLTPERVITELCDMAFAGKGDQIYTPNIKLKALELLQKQLGWQKAKLEAEVKGTVINVSIDDDGDQPQFG